MGGFIETTNDLIKSGLFQPTRMELICVDGTVLTRKLDNMIKTSVIANALANRLPAMLIVRGSDVRIYYELCVVPSTMAPEDAIRHMDSPRESRVAVLSCREGVDIAAKMCERTLRGYLSTGDFNDLFSEKIEILFRKERLE